MAKKWTKIRADIVRSTRMAALLETNALGYALYMNAKAVCDDYGLMEADPRKFKGMAAPMSYIPLEAVAEALDAMETCGVIRRYEVGGDPYLEIVSYNEIEETVWNNVAGSMYPRPPWWTPPQCLLDFLAKPTKDDRITPERYGVTIERVSGDGRTTVGRQANDSKTVSGDGRSTVAGASNTDSDSESSESKTLSENAGNVPAPSDPTADPASEKARLKAEKDRRDAERMRQQTERLDNALAALPDEDRDTANRMIQAQAEEKGKQLTLLQQAQLVETYRDELADHGPQCWRECCHIALEKAHGSVAYAKACTKTWVPQTTAPALSLVGPQVEVPAAKPLDPDFAKRWDEERNARRLTDAN